MCSTLHSTFESILADVQERNRLCDGTICQSKGHLFRFCFCEHTPVTAAKSHNINVQTKSFTLRAFPSSRVRAHTWRRRDRKGRAAVEQCSVFGKQSLGADVASPQAERVQHRATDTIMSRCVLFPGPFTHIVLRIWFVGFYQLLDQARGWVGLVFSARLRSNIVFSVRL